MGPGTKLGSKQVIPTGPINRSIPSLFILTYVTDKLHNYLYVAAGGFCRMELIYS